MSDYIMEKIRTLSDVEMKILKKGRVTRSVREMINANPNKKYSIGDTAAYTKHKDIQIGDFFECIHNGKSTYYAVAQVIKDDLAMCYTVYQN